MLNSSTATQFGAEVRPRTCARGLRGRDPLGGCRPHEHLGDVWPGDASEEPAAVANMLLYQNDIGIFLGLYIRLWGLTVCGNNDSFLDRNATGNSQLLKAVLASTLHGHKSE